MSATGSKYLQGGEQQVFTRTARERLRSQVRQIWRASVCAALAVIAYAGPATSQTGPLPAGQIVLGPVVRGQSFARLGQQGTSVASITNGVDANNFLDGLITPTTLSFVNSTSSSAVAILTAVPTQFVRFYTGNGQQGSFIVGSNAVRGLTPEQIRDVLALPGTPTMQTIVQVPAGTCLLFGTAGPILNAAPPNNPTGVWGRGGAVQQYVIGRQQDQAGCSSSAQYPLFLPQSSFVEAQPLGALALLYGPRAGGGNAGAVAGALDRRPYPALFTGMDSMYNSLDLLNYGTDPTPLREALLQLDGEVHASARTAILSDSVYLRETLLGRMRQASFMGGAGPGAALGLGGPTLAYLGGADSHAGDLDSDSALAYSAQSKAPFPVKAPPPAAQPAPETVLWAQGVGAWGKLNGNGNAANVNRDLAGVFAGIDRRFAPNWLVGLAGGYTNSSLSIADPTSSAGIETGHVAGYTAASFGPWNLRGAASGSFHTVDTSRAIIFPGFSDFESARYHATTAQVFGEVGYGASFGQIATEPFAGLAFVHLNTDGFAETGSNNIAALSGSSSTEDVGYSSLGARAAINYVLANGFVVTPHVSAAWQHAFGTINPTAALAFESNGASFVTAGVPLAQDAALVEAGFDLNLTRQLALQVAYFGQLASRIQDNSVMGNVRWRF